MLLSVAWRQQLELGPAGKIGAAFLSDECLRLSITGPLSDRIYVNFFRMRLVGRYWWYQRTVGTCHGNGLRTGRKF